MIPYHQFNYFLFRTPLLPFESLKEECNPLDNKAFSEALLIASPELFEEAVKIQNKQKTPLKQKTGIENSLYRYFQRACTRPTPFGLFAGCATGTVGDRTDIHLSELQSYKRVTRLDMNYICALTQKIEKDRSIREQLCYYPNSSIYPTGNHLRYVEYNYRKTRRMHRIEQVENSEYLQNIISFTRNGAKFIEIVATLVNDEITTEEATEFLHELIDAQILVSELEPAVTNVKPLSCQYGYYQRHSTGIDIFE